MIDRAGAPVLPAEVLVGVATAGYQVEGGFNGPGQPANNWVGWERSGRVEPSGIACNFWDEPEQCLDRAAALGCNAFRLSVEWARIEPEEGVVDDTALDRYDAILEACADRGLEPLVTLHHFTHPWWLGEEFWLRPGAPDRFSEHVARVVGRLAGRCRHWVTINEPNIVALMGWVEGATPPGRRLAAADAIAVLDNLLTAHVLAYAVVHRLQPEAVVTLNTSASSIYEHDRLLTDLVCARSRGVARDDLDRWIEERRAFHDAAFPPHALGELALRRLFATLAPYGAPAPAPGDRAGTARRAKRRLRRPTPGRLVDALYDGPHVRPLDVTGFDWYDPVASHALRWPGHASAGGRSWGASRAIWDVAPDPAGLTAWCAEQHALLPDQAVWVVENGMASRVSAGRSHPRLDGWDRPAYLRAHLAAVVAARDAGVPVEAYFHWSLVDNYEWGTYEPRLGIFGLDRREEGIRWLATDAMGRDAAGEYRRLLTGLREGDRSVLEPGGR